MTFAHFKVIEIMRWCDFHTASPKVFFDIIIADDYVEKDFGTGCVKITPAHDFNDFEMGKRHNLPMINIFNLNAEVLCDFDYFEKAGAPITETIPAPAEYVGLERFAARKKLVLEATENGWLDKIETYTLKAPKGDRSGVIVEPLLSDQWDVALSELAKPAIDAVQNGSIKFVPEQYSNMYMAWMNNLQDWCISRQLWWGSRIPAWYDATGNIYVGRDEAEVRAKHALGAEVALSQDSDVLETWFSSALWPISTMGWPNAELMQQRGFDRYVPSSVLVTGFDIIFFWVARTLMMTDHLMPQALPDAQRIPFKDVY